MENTRIFRFKFQNKPITAVGFVECDEEGDTFFAVHATIVHDGGCVFASFNIGIYGLSAENIAAFVQGFPEDVVKAEICEQLAQNIC